MIGARRRAARLAGVLACAATLVAGCGFRGIADVPLPGGADLGSHPFTIRIEFTNVLDLAPQSLVKLNNVTVGRIDDIRLRGWHALVTCRVRGNVNLPDNATAKIEQTTLLGEKFIQLGQPAKGTGRGHLGGGDLIPLNATSESAEVEQVLSAMAMLLNGGGIEQIATINTELNRALGGREDEIRKVLKDINRFTGGLDRQRRQIVRTIRNVDRLSGRLKRNRRTIDDTLHKVTPAITVLAGQRRNLTKLLTSLDKLGRVTQRTIKRSKKDTLANLRRLRPIVKNLADTGDDLPRGLEMAATFPFPPSVDNGVKGDYANLYATVDLDLDDVLHNLLTGTALDGLVNRKQLRKKLNSLVNPPYTAPTRKPLGVRDDPGGPGPLGLGGHDPAKRSSGPDSGSSRSSPDPSTTPTTNGQDPSTGRSGGGDSLTRLLLGGLS